MARTVRRSDPEQQRRTRRTLILAVVLGLVAVIVLVVLSFALRLSGGPPLPRDVRERMRQEKTTAVPPGAPAPGSGGAATPAQVPASVPTGTPPLGEQVRRAKEAAASGVTTTQRIYVTDSELSSVLGEAVRKNPEVESARAYFDTGKAYLTARVNARGRTWNLTLVLEPVVVNGAVQFGVSEAFVGKVAAPPAIVDRIQKEMGKRGLAFAPEKTGLYVEQVELKPGVAVLTGRPVSKR